MSGLSRRVILDDMLKRVLATLAVTALSVLTVGSTIGESSAQAAVLHRASTRCLTPAPDSAAGYQAMFAKVPTTQFGAADVGISVPTSDGRSVWLWGDTFSEGRFVHSTAITQDRGCLHVSYAGTQLLPNDDATHIYWIQSGKASGSTVYVTARSVTLTGSCGWCFADGGFSRTAITTLNRAGDLTFVSWGPKVASPAPDPGPLVALGPHHYAYSFQLHPEAKLASGRVLQSAAQNWDDGVLHPFEDYRVIFTEVDSAGVAVGSGSVAR